MAKGMKSGGRRRSFSGSESGKIVKNFKTPLAKFKKHDILCLRCAEKQSSGVVLYDLRSCGGKIEKSSIYRLQNLKTMIYYDSVAPDDRSTGMLKNRFRKKSKKVRF